MEGRNRLGRLVVGTRIIDPFKRSLDNVVDSEVSERVRITGFALFRSPGPLQTPRAPVLGSIIISLYTNTKVISSFDGPQ